MEQMKWEYRSKGEAKRKQTKENIFKTHRNDSTICNNRFLREMAKHMKKPYIVTIKKLGISLWKKLQVFSV